MPIPPFINSDKIINDNNYVNFRAHTHFHICQEKPKARIGTLIQVHFSRKKDNQNQPMYTSDLILYLIATGLLVRLREYDNYNNNKKIIFST